MTRIPKFSLRHASKASSSPCAPSEAAESLACAQPPNAARANLLQLAAPTQTEASLQAQVAQFLRIALPRNAMFHHSPGEGKRGWRAQASLKASGFVTGWPDVEIIWGGRVLFLELKSLRGRLTPAQVACHKSLQEAGSAVAVVRSVEEAAKQLAEWGVPLRARL